jgi:hypothetical protein
MVLIFTIPIRANLTRLGLDKVNTFLLRFPKLALPPITTDGARITSINSSILYDKNIV